jgi:hypothetical protein
MSEWDNEKLVGIEDKMKRVRKQLDDLNHQSVIVSDKADALWKKYPNDVFVCANPSRNDPDFDSVHMNPPQSYMNYPELFVVQEFPGVWFYEGEMDTNEPCDDAHETFYLRKNSPATNPMLKLIASMIELEKRRRQFKSLIDNFLSMDPKDRHKAELKVEGHEWDNIGEYQSEERRYEALSEEKELLISRIRALMDKHRNDLAGRFVPDLEGGDPTLPWLVGNNEGKFHHYEYEGTSPMGTRGVFHYYVRYGSNIERIVSTTMRRLHWINSHIPAEYR